MKNHLVTCGMLIVTVAALVTAEEMKKPVCAVTGFLNEVNNEQWHDARVGMGVRAMLTQSIHATGLFTLIEEKPEIQEQLNKLRTDAWLDRDGDASLKEAGSVLKNAGAAFTVYGSIFYFGKPRTKASVGPVHLSADEVIIKISVTLTDVKKGKKLKVTGTGKAKTTSQSVLFTFHEDRLDADKSMVATATAKAIDEAVAALAKKYRKKYRIR